MQANPEPALTLKEALIRCRRAFIYAGVFSLCINILMLVLPLYSLQVLDRVLGSHSLETLAMLTLVALVSFIFLGLFTAVRTAVFLRISEWLDVKLSPKLLSLAIGRTAAGLPTSASQILRDFSAIRNFVTGNGATTLFDAPWSLIFIFVVYMISPVLGLVAVVGAIVLFLFAVLSEVATKKSIDAANANFIKSMNLAEAATRNAEAIEAMGMMPSIVEHWTRHNGQGLELQNRVNNRSNIIQSTSKIVRLVLQIAVIGIGGWLALDGHMTAGGMIASSILTGRALAPFEAAIGVWKSFVTARDAHHRILHTMMQTPYTRGTMPLPAPVGHLQVENLVYRPTNTDKPIIKGITFQLAPGESLGIIGPSAAGKSTLAKLIVGILQPSHGSVRLDGAETFKWNREDFGQYVGYLPQEVELFAGTIKDNIARMDMDAPPERVIEAAMAAGVHEMILRLPNGYETTVSPGNLTLSPGQRQRIGLARALYCQPRFLVLDEPNLNLDGEGERALVQALANIRGRQITTILVAHRPSIVGSVDKILTLRDGLIETFGPRDQVLQRYVVPAQQVAAAGGQK